ncbi:MAG: hypothetical protein PHG85_05390 [Candidatus Altiarchaeota archaeon]|nr:hypothetical protein [Candidatus Altiarchaeota archaeon]
MRLFLSLAVFCLVALAFSGFASAADCEGQYNSCITDCCRDCGSYTMYNDNGDLVCYLGSAGSVNQRCVDACLPCSRQYQDCVQAGSGPSEDTGGGSPGCCSCCGALILPALAAASALLAKSGLIAL